MSSFDADALERAAKAARDLEKSAHAKAAVELAKREQNVEARKADATRAASMAEMEKAKVAQAQVQGEERRKTIEFEHQKRSEMLQRQAQMEMQKQQEADKLARARDRDNLEARKQADMEREALRRQTERDIQAERMRAAEQRAKLERDNMVARAMAEAEGRIKEQRANEDIIARQIRLRGEERMKQLRAAIETTFKELGTSIGGYLADYERLRNTVLVGTALAGGFFAVRESARVAGRLIERRLLTPSLVRETSRRGLFGGAAPGAAASSSSSSSWFSRGSEGAGLLDGVVLEAGLTDRVAEAAVSTANTKKNGAPFRHMLFYGPPGTGKTLVAKKLAHSSGLDYAIMSGGDVGPLGGDAVTELHKLLDWGETTSKGLLLFIDEADAFLASRSRSSMSEPMRNALNALLYRTGTASRSLMLVLATNRPGDLDAAVTDRVDEAMLFGLPGPDGRERLLRQYFDEYVVRAGSDAPRRLWGLLPAAGASRISIPDGEIPEGYFEELAARTEGFSGRAISKLMLAVQGAVYGTESGELTLKLMEEVVGRKLDEFEARKELGGLDYTKSSSMEAEAVTG